MSDNPWILGISCSHNGSVCLLHGDEIVVAIQEERLSRIKRHRVYGSQPLMALEYCFDYAGIQPSDLSLVVYCVQGRARDPRHDLTLNPYLNLTSNRIPILAAPHHYCHAVSAFATSGFEDSAVMVIDGAGSHYEDLFEGERKVAVESIESGLEIISLYGASGTTITPVEKHLAEQWLNLRVEGMARFGSLGGIFSAAARQIFGDESEAGKVMGLAPYGRPDIPTGEFFNISSGRFNFFDNVPNMFQHNDRWPSRKTEYENLSCSAQVALEDALMYLAERLRDLFPCENLCYAGGVALNSVANERIISQSGFKNVYIMPAAEDSGPSVGAAYYGLWQLTKKNTRRKLVHDMMGGRYSSSTIAKAIDRAPAVELIDSKDVISDAVDLLCEGKIIGWFQGGSELGPRALGQRSILCDPRRVDAKEVLNSRVKHREAFRPFAPAILIEEVDEWFELNGACADSPFMLRVCNFKKDKMSKVPAVVHVDGTGRIQTVTSEGNGLFYDLIKRFFEKTGVPIILNTSFNTMGEPIVETPEDALFCLLNTGLDYCVFEDKIVTKKGGFPSQACASLLSKIQKIKERVNRQDNIKDTLAVERMKDKALEKIYIATVQALRDYDEEIHGYLGCTLPDFRRETFVKTWGEMLTNQVWESFDKATQDCMVTAGLAHSLLTRYPNRQKDWAAVEVGLLRAIEIELNSKLIAPFGAWLASQKVVEVDDLLSKAAGCVQEPWLRFLKSVRKNNGVRGGKRLPLGSICRAFGDAYGSARLEHTSDAEQYRKSLLKLLAQFASYIRAAPWATLLEFIGTQMAAVSAAREESLRMGFLERYKAIDLIEKIPAIASGLNTLETKFIDTLHFHS